MVLLQRHAGEMHVGLQVELTELLAVMVYQYFSRYSSMKTEMNEMRVMHLLEGNNRFDNWEHSDVAMAVTMLIIGITQQLLPSFSAHRSEDCAGIINITMHNDHVALLEIDPVAYERFIQPRSS